MIIGKVAVLADPATGEVATDAFRLYAVAEVAADVFASDAHDAYELKAFFEENTSPTNDSLANDSLANDPATTLKAHLEQNARSVFTGFQTAFRDPAFSLPALAAQTFSKPGVYAVSIRLVSVDEMTELNDTYRNRKAPTNVLSFPALDVAELAAMTLAVTGADDSAPATDVHDTAEWQLPLGDIAICGSVVIEEAAASQKSANAHLTHMLVHGMLHLLGFDHEVEAEAQSMESMERHILSKLGLPDPYILKPESGSTAKLRGS